MNKIFKSIWNHVTRTFTAVSEIQQTNGKKAKATALASTIALGFASLTAHANYDGKYDDEWRSAYINDNSVIYLYDNNPDIEAPSGTLHPWVIGYGNAARDYGSLSADNGAIYDGYYLHITEQEAVLNLSQVDEGNILFSQSTNVQSQILVKAETWEGRDSSASDFNVINDSREDSTTAYVQQIAQNNENGVQDVKADATYLIGAQAAKYVNVTDSDGNKIINGHAHSSSSGIYDNSHQEYSQDDPYGADTSIDEGLYIAALLQSVSIRDNKTLDLTVQGQEAVWSAQILGNGGISYTGDSASSTLLTLRDTFGFGTNNYYGPTNIDSISLDLNRKNAFGQASSITASDAVININQSDAWTSAGGASFNRLHSEFHRRTK